MKPWTKFEYAMLKDERIARLIRCQGMKGFGLYCMLRIITDCVEGCDEREVATNIIGCTSKRLIKRVLHDYDLFEENGFGHLHACMRVGERAGQREGERAGQRAQEPISLENKNKEYTSVGSVTVEEEQWWTKYKNEPWFPRIAELLSENNMPWREPLLMHCGYGGLLGAHWQEAVKFFIEHAIIQNELPRLMSERECKQYFANFSRISVASGRALQDFLLSLNTLKQQPPSTKNELWE